MTDPNELLEELRQLTGNTTDFDKSNEGLLDRLYQISTRFIKI
jgi:hypothetical protein